MVCTGNIFHGDVFLYGGLGKLLPQGQCLRKFRRRILQQFQHSLFVERIRFDFVLREPSFHLLHGVGIVHTCESFHLLAQFLARSGIDSDGVIHEFHIDANTAIVDFLVEMIFIPKEVRDGEFGEPMLDRHLDLDITLVVRLEHCPLIWGMAGKIACPAAVRFGGRAGHAEEANKGLSFCHFLLFKSKDAAYIGKREGKSHVRCPNHGASPAFGAKEGSTEKSQV